MKLLLKLSVTLLPVVIMFLIIATMFEIRKEQRAQNLRLKKVEVAALFMIQKFAPEIAAACNKEAVKEGGREVFMDTHIAEGADLLLHEEDEGNFSALARIKSEGLQCDFVASYGAVIAKLSDPKATAPN